jgi:hypothetical protein
LIGRSKGFLLVLAVTRPSEIRRDRMSVYTVKARCMLRLLSSGSMPDGQNDGYVRQAPLENTDEDLAVEVEQAWDLADVEQYDRSAMLEAFADLRN